MKSHSLLAIPLLAILAIAASPVAGKDDADVKEPFRSWLAERGLAGLVDGSMAVQVSVGLGGLCIGQMPRLMDEKRRKWLNSGNGR